MERAAASRDPHAGQAYGPVLVHPRQDHRRDGPGWERDPLQGPGHPSIPKKGAGTGRPPHSRPTSRQAAAPNRTGAAEPGLGSNITADVNRASRAGPGQQDRDDDRRTRGWRITSASGSRRFVDPKGHADDAGGLGERAPRPTWPACSSRRHPADAAAAKARRGRPEEGHHRENSTRKSSPRLSTASCPTSEP